jgi:hypothetical protein
MAANARTKEDVMRRLALLGAAALIVAALAPTDASAQRGRGIAVGGGVVRGAAIGRGVGIGGGGYAIRSAAVGPRYGIRGGVGWVGRPGLRRAWGLPIIAAGIAAASYGYGYGYGYGYDPGYGYSAGYDGCVGWDGYQWVSVCYQPPPLAGGGQYLAPY